MTKFPIGDEASFTASISVTPTLAAASHADGDSFGGKLTFANAARSKNAGGTIKSIIITSEAAIADACDFDLYFFDTDPTNSTLADDAAPVFHDDDLPGFIGHYLVDTSAVRKDVGDQDLFTCRDVNIPFMCGEDSDNIWMVMVSNGAAHVTAVGDLIIKLVIQQD